MRYAPSASECAAIETMTGPALLEYFITRAAEAEEVWGLGDETGWVMRENDSQTILPVWPYQQFAEACKQGEWRSQLPNAVSLEHFIFNIMKILIEQNIQIEIMPAASRPGHLVAPQYLFKLFESVIDSGEYFLEG